MLSQSVASAIRDAISAGEFQPGQQLSEVKAAERFKCSRNTLREAFTELTSERLVERIPNRGVFIATPDTDYVKDLYLARMALEHAGVLWGDFPPPTVSLSWPLPRVDFPKAAMTKLYPASISASTARWWRRWAQRLSMNRCPAFSRACA